MLDPMDRSEVAKLAKLEDRHWWYAARRRIIRNEATRISTRGIAFDVGAAGGGNTRVLRENGWDAIPVEYGDAGAAIAASRGLPAVQADATRLPFTEGSGALVVAFDVLEHIEDHDRAVAEFRRVLRIGGILLIAVPADQKLWSAHDEAVGHVRRYARNELVDLVRRNRFVVDEVHSWNVLLRPAVRWRRKSSTGSDLDECSPLVNAALGSVVRLEQWLPVGRWPGVSLILRAHKSGA